MPTIAVPFIRRATSLALLCSVLVSTAGSLLLVGPSLSRLSDHVIGLGGDPYQTLWRFTQLRKASLEGTLVVAGDPVRNLGPLPWLPLDLLLREPLAYNVVWLLQAPLTALATSIFAQQLGLKPMSSILAGLLVAFSPYRLAQSLGHFGAMQLFWIPAVLAAFAAWLRWPTGHRAVIAALLLVGTAWTEHTLFLTTLLALGTTAVVAAPLLREITQRKRVWMQVGVALGLLLVGVGLPFREEFRRIAAEPSTLNPGPIQRLRFSPTVQSLLGLAPFHLARRDGAPYGTVDRTVADRIHVLGWVAPLLAVGSILAYALPVLFSLRPSSEQAPPGSSSPTSTLASRRTLYLSLLASVGIGLALLPRTAVGMTIVEALPLLSAVRTFGRFTALAALAVPLLALATTERIAQRRRSGSPVVGAALLVFLVAEVLPQRSFPVMEADVPAYGRALPTAEPGMVLVTGAGTDYLLASQALFASAVHGFPLLGHNAFERVEDRSVRTELLRVPVVRDLLLHRIDDLSRLTFFAQDPTRIAHAALASEGVTTVILHRRVLTRFPLRVSSEGPRELTASEIEALRIFFSAAGFREMPVEDGVFLYHVPSWQGQSSVAIALRGPGWERIGRRVDGTVQAALTDRAAFDVRIVGPRALRLAFAAKVVSPHSARLRLSGPVTDTVRAHGGDTVRFDLGLLAPGAHHFALGVDGPEIIVENPSVTPESL